MIILIKNDEGLPIVELKIPKDKDIVFHHSKEMFANYDGCFFSLEKPYKELRQLKERLSQ